VTEPKDIGDRLTNWAEWCNGAPSRAGDCITGVICERMRKAALGSEWDGNERRRVDEPDAVLIGRLMVRLSLPHRRLLGWHYVEKATRSYVARLLRFHHSKYDQLLTEAQAAIEQAADNGNTLEKR